MASRLATGRGRFAGHMAVVCWVVAVGLPVSAVIDVVPFLWPHGGTSLLVGLVSAFLMGALLHLHLGVASRLGPRRRATAAALVTAGLWLVTLALVEIDESPEGDVSPSLGSLWPVPEQWIPAQSVDDLVAGLDEIDGELAAQLEEE